MWDRLHANPLRAHGVKFFLGSDGQVWMKLETMKFRTRRRLYEATHSTY